MDRGTHTHVYTHTRPSLFSRMCAIVFFFLAFVFSRRFPAFTAVPPPPEGSAIVVLVLRQHRTHAIPDSSRPSSFGPGGHSVYLDRTLINTHLVGTPKSRLFPNSHRCALMTSSRYDDRNLRTNETLAVNICARSFNIFVGGL